MLPDQEDIAMPDYMLLLHADEKAGLALPKEVMAQWMEKMHAYKAALDKAGAHVAHGALGTSKSASIVHLDRAGEMQVHDGPFAEAKEQLGGYYVINAATTAEAQIWAAKCPGAIWGHIEIRDIEGLRRTSCECYAAVRLHYERLLGPVG